MIRLKQAMALIGLLAVLIMPWAIDVSKATAVENAQSPIADVSYAFNTIYFSPKVSYESLVLRISLPNGEVVERAFAADIETPYIAVGGNWGTFSQEGRYNYELSLIAAPRTRSETGLATAGLDNGSPKGLTQAGTFLVSDGVLINGSDVEAPYVAQTDADAAAGDPPLAADDAQIARDQVILDDLIVDGSACIGFDCVNGESFGFDTIRLKENNLRIRFFDTSNTASFPTRDWQITANDTSNGGANKFSIDDIDGGRTPFTIEAGAPSHSLYVEDGGRIGLGTSTPVADVHVKTGNTPTVRLEQDGSSGFSPQTWDVAGNEANFFVRDATNGSTLVFRIIPGAPSNSIYIDAEGDVGLNTTSPDQELDIEASGPNFRLTNTGAAEGVWDFRMNANTGRLIITDDSSSARNPIKVGPGAVDNLLKIGINAADQIDIAGTLFVNGSEITPDYVFEKNYQLESIEEHASFMWREKHLPAIAPAQVNADGKTRINIGARSQGMLEEIEKAHIYIEQLHHKIDDLKARLAQLEAYIDKPSQTKKDLRELK